MIEKQDIGGHREENEARNTTHHLVNKYMVILLKATDDAVTRG